MHQVIRIRLWLCLWSLKSSLLGNSNSNRTCCCMFISVTVTLSCSVFTITSTRVPMVIFSDMMSVTSSVKWKESFETTTRSNCRSGPPFSMELASAVGFSKGDNSNVFLLALISNSFSVVRFVKDFFYAARTHHVLL